MVSLFDVTTLVSVSRHIFLSSRKATSMSYNIIINNYCYLFTPDVSPWISTITKRRPAGELCFGLLLLLYVVAIVVFVAIYCTTPSMQSSQSPHSVGHFFKRHFLTASTIISTFIYHRRQTHVHNTKRNKIFQK